MSVHPTHEELVAHIESFARRHGHSDTVLIVADGLEPILQDQFQMEHRVRPTEGTPCIARLISDWDRCQHGTGEKRTATPPHEPLNASHADLWLADGEPVAYSLHRRELGHHDLQDLLAFAHEWDLELRFDPASYAAPNRAVHVVLLSGQ